MIFRGVLFASTYQVAKVAIMKANRKYDREDATGIRQNRSINCKGLLVLAIYLPRMKFSAGFG